MAAITPRRSMRIPHNHTPKMSERKKGLFQTENEPSRESLTKHRNLPVVDSETDSDDCDLGIISTLDSSSGDENDQGTPKTRNRGLWPETRSHSRKLLKETQDIKNFIKSPFTLKKYQTRYTCPESKCTGSLSTPATPHFHNHPGTPSSTHSCASVHTTSSTSSRARKSLASLIADTESCSSSLKDLNFDTDSGTDSKENTPTKGLRRSARKQKTPKTPLLQSFKGVLMEQKKNTSPMKTAVVCLTKMDMSSLMSPTKMLKTPNNTNTDSNQSPPKLGHNRRSVVEIEESPESTCDSEKSHKRLRNDSITDPGPNPKYPRIDNTVPKARLSLFNSDRLKEILSAKSFYGKSNPELNTNITAKISNAIEVTNTHHRRPFSHSHSNRRKRKPGQINLGVRHRIRKPRVHKNNIIKMKGNSSMNSTANSSIINNTVASNVSAHDASMREKSQNSSQDLTFDKQDPFDKEKQTIEALLSQWTEEEVPESELSFTKSKPDLPCFNSTVIEETSPIFQPVTAVPVPVQALPQDKEAVIVELGLQAAALNPNQNQSIPEGPGTTAEVPQDVVMIEPEGHKGIHGEIPKNAPFLPVDGGYIFVGDGSAAVQEELPDLDEIERELRMLDEQILRLARSNNMDAAAVLASTETPAPAPPAPAPPAATDGKIERELRMLDEQILRLARSNNMDAAAVLASTETPAPAPPAPAPPAATDGKIERELRMLDEQILRLARSNNMDAAAVLASTETPAPAPPAPAPPAATDGKIERELRMLDEQILRLARSNNMDAAAVLASTETPAPAPPAPAPPAATDGKIERELRMLDEQILRLARSNNMDAAAVLASTETPAPAPPAPAPPAATDGKIERELRMLDEQILRLARSNNMDAAAVLASTETPAPAPPAPAPPAATDGKIERELRMLDEQILRLARSNNMDAAAVLASTETPAPAPPAPAPPAATDCKHDLPVASDKPQKLFPIFSNPNPGTSTSTCKGTDKTKKSLLKNGDDQYVIDAGQKKFGATQCSECGAIYQIGDPQDEHDHLVHHNASDVLRYNGYKDECVVHRTETGRCIRVRGGEGAWRKVEALLDRVVHPHLGLPAALPEHRIHTYTAYLYIEKKQIVGCLIVEPKTKAYKLIPGDPDCCSVEEYPVKCGVSRLWTHSGHRRRGLARCMLDCARASLLLMYGAALGVNDLAFSAPTAQGKAFAAKYCGTDNFYVYLD